MQRFGSILASSAAVTLVVLWFGAILVLEIGGITYRKDCITQSGAVSKSWTITWFAPLPFLFRPSEEGCNVHSGVRVAMNSAGLFPYAETSVSAAARSAGADTSLSKGQRYYALLYADLKDMRDYNVAHPHGIQGGVDELRKTGALIAKLDPPASVATEHAQLVAVFARAARLGDRALAAVDTKDEAEIAKVSAQLNAVTAEQNDLTQSIEQKLRAEAQ